MLKVEFNKKCNPKSKKNHLDCIKYVDPTRLSSCLKVLLQHIKLASYVAHLYLTTHNAHPAFDLFPMTMVMS